MAFDPISLIRTRSREQWQQWAADLYSNLRGWVQQNGEKASLVAFAMGIALVMFYKFIIGLFALGVIAAFVGWNIALPESAAPGSSTDESGD
ncbi:MAG: hypothetical protein EBZ48_13245 [Proteobacteria bacterium]|nr:hypothetical protein [Pseudomonadota bacterium]